MLHVDDWLRLAPVWSEFAPKVYAQYPNLLAEMYAYCMAAAHLQLQHVRVNHLMLSNVAVARDEGWALVDSLPLDLACPADANAGFDPPIITPWGRTRYILPVFLHFCQNYRLGDWMFAKRRVPHGIISDCAHDLLAMPSHEISKLRYELQPPGNPCREEPKRPYDFQTASAKCMPVCSLGSSFRHMLCLQGNQSAARYTPTELHLPSA